MKTDEFKSWLQAKYPDYPQTASARFANWNTIEKYYGDLDAFYKKDNGRRTANSPWRGFAP